MTAVLAALLVALVVRFATNGGGAPAEAVGPAAPNQMAIDADPGTPGIQTSRTVSGGAPFQVDIHITQDTDPFGAYEWLVGVDHGLAFAGTFIDVLPLHGCFAPQVIPNSVVTYYGSCRLSTTETTHVGVTTSISIQCGENGTFAVHLLDKSASAFGSSLLDIGGSALDTGTQGIVVECGGIPVGATATATNTPTPTQTPLPPGDNIAAIDADVTMAGVQTTRDVFGTAPFLVDVYVTSLGSTPYQGFQWLARFTSGSLAFTGSVANHTADTGLGVCSPVFPQELPPYTELRGIGCISVALPSTFVGRMLSIELQCLADGLFDIKLLSTADDPIWGTTLLAPGGAIIPTLTESAAVNCFVSPTATPTVTPTSTPTVTPTPATGGGIVSPADVITEDNVWICKTNDGAPSVVCGGATLTQLIQMPDDIDTCNDDDDGDGEGCAAKIICLTPNAEAYDPPCNPGDPSMTVSASTDWDGDQQDLDLNGGETGEGLGAFEFQVKFDHKLLQHPTIDFSDTVLDDTGRVINCSHDIVTENWVTFGCTSKANADGDGIAGEQEDYPHAGPSVAAPSVLAHVTFAVQPDLYQRIRPTKDNGARADLLDENCEAADIFGSPYDAYAEPNGQTESPAGGLAANCTDVTLTIRMLEGDVDLDCDVDVSDDQRIAFRYGAAFGVLAYDKLFDLEPNTTPPDFDVDIKDLQFVFGRDGSTCEAPVPPQDPQPQLPDP